MPQVNIRIERGQEQPGEANINQKTSQDEKKSMTATSIFAHKMMGISKQIVSYAASNVGSYTGDYILQDKINNIMDVFNDASTIGAGIAAGGVVGGIAASLGVATKKALEMITDRRNDVLQERDRNYLLARSGNATTNGSRGTEN